MRPLNVRQYLLVVAVGLVVAFGIWSTRDGGWLDSLIFGETAHADQCTYGNPLYHEQSAPCTFRYDYALLQRTLQYMMMMMRLLVTGGRAT